MARFHITALIRAAAIAAVLLTFIPEEAAAQAYAPVPVTISKEKVKIDGNICYSHIVLEKQTLYSISKAYNVSIEDIYRFNPTLKETGLKKNGIIVGNQRLYHRWQASRVELPPNRARAFGILRHHSRLGLGYRDTSLDGVLPRREQC